MTTNNKLAAAAAGLAFAIAIAPGPALAAPIHDAARRADIGLVAKLVKAGADINERDLNGRTPLIIAARGGETDLVEVLLILGADVRLRDEDGTTALHAAMLSGDLGSAGLLRQAGVRASAMPPSSADIHVSAAVFHPADVVADGTWQCSIDGSDVGSVVLADLSYALIGPDAKLVGRGELHPVSTDLDLPHFAILSGPLKQDWHALGISMRGPKDNPHVLTGQLFLAILVSDAIEYECVRWQRPAA